MTLPSPLDVLLRHAWRRRLANQILAGTAFAASLAIAGLILVLLFGTGLLDWSLPVVLFFAGLGWGGYRARRRLLPDYQLAQEIDRRLNLRDMLSTALF